MDAEGEILFHYTDADGYNVIRSQPVWVFKASQPPGNHPFGAYFTTLRPGTANLAKRLRIPKGKLEYVFCVVGSADLVPLAGGRGQYVVYRATDYRVEPDRQVDHGPTTEVAGRVP
jgi:hypothetical protein